MTELQKEILKVFKAFKQLCEQYDLQYYASAGTLLGTIRHKGFIPWDDDIDVVMPLEDYKKFIKICSVTQSLKGFGLLNPLTSKTKVGTFSKFYSTDTMFTSLEQLGHPDLYTGVYIDIFPLISTSSNDIQRVSHQENLESVIKKLHHKSIYNKGDTPVNKLVSQYISLRDKYSYEKSDIVQYGGFPPGYPLNKLTFDKETFSSFSEMPFEDTMIRVPVGYHSQLKTQYGDYMTLPPKSERVAHTSFCLVDLQKSCLEYSKEALNSHLLPGYRQLLIEKWDILQRIPPLEERIRVEMDRVKREVQELNRYKNPSVRLAVKLFIRAVTRKLKSIF